MNRGREWTVKDPADSDDLWATTQRLNAESPGRGEWVPKAAISIPAWQVRGLNEDKVREYAEVSDDLPPIRVQRDTFVLIDGRHRFSAEPSDCIRIVEDDIADADLFAESVRANTGHGLPYTREERRKLIKELVRRYPDWTDLEVARVAGCHRQTVAEHRPHVESSHVENVENRRSQLTSDQREPAPLSPAPAPPTGLGQERATEVGESPGWVDPDPNDWHESEPEAGEESADDDVEQNTDAFSHVLAGFQLRASMECAVPNLQGPSAERFRASVHLGIAALREWCDQIELEYGR